MFNSKLIKKTSWLFSSYILLMGVGFLYSILKARALTVEEFGMLVFTLTLAGIGNLIFNFGASDAASRLVLKNTEDKNEIIGTVLIISAIIGTCFAASFAGFSFLVDHIFKSNIAHIMLYIAPFMILLPLQETIQETLKGLHKIKSLAIYRAAPTIIALLTVFTLFLIKEIYAITVLTASYTALTIVTLYMVHQLKPKFQNIKQHTKELIKEIKSYGFYIYIARAIDIITYETDKLVLGFFFSTTVIGYYGLAVLFVTPLSYFAKSIGQVKFKGFYTEQGISKKVLNTNRTVLSIGLLTYFIIGNFLFITLFGDKYTPALAIIPILAVAMFFAGLYQPYNQYLASKGQGKALRNIAIGTSTLNILLNFTLIPLFNIMGAAAATVISIIGQYMLHRIYYKKYENRT